MALDYHPSFFFGDTELDVFPLLSTVPLAQKDFLYTQNGALRVIGRHPSHPSTYFKIDYFHPDTEQAETLSQERFSQHPHEDTLAHVIRMSLVNPHHQVSPRWLMHLTHLALHDLDQQVSGTSDQVPYYTESAEHYEQAYQTLLAQLRETGRLRPMDIVPSLEEAPSEDIPSVHELEQQLRL